MKITTVMFDLDGTLLPMNQDEFIQSYLTRMGAYLAPLGYDPQQLVSAIWNSTMKMVANDGSRTNEEVFWNSFCSIYGDDARNDEWKFDEFYQRDFCNVRRSCGFSPRAREVIDLVKGRGLRAVLATNPIFPAVATESRIRWAGLEREDFELCTTFENSRYSKPNPDYYRSIMKQLNVRPEECLMVGNDVEEDMIAAELGCRVFLLTDCLIAKSGVDISRYPNGGFDELIRTIELL